MSHPTWNQKMHSHERQISRKRLAMSTAPLVALSAGSMLCWPQAGAVAQTLNLQFSGSGNNLAATGFDAAYNLDPTGFNVANGRLTITTQPGDTFGDYENDPDTAKNVFYTNVASVPTRSVLEARLTVSDLNANFHGGGIWMGTDEDHYLRLGVINNSFEGGVTIEGLRENEDLWPPGHGEAGDDYP